MPLFAHWIALRLLIPRANSFVDSTLATLYLSMYQIALTLLTMHEGTVNRYRHK